ADGTMQDEEAYRALADEIDRHRDRLGPILRAQLEQAAALTPAAYDEARRLARQARRAFGDLMGGIDIILTPSAPGAAPHGPGSTRQTQFNPLSTLRGGTCLDRPGPVCFVGHPPGVQIVGRFARDRLTLEAAAFLQRALASS